MGLPTKLISILADQTATESLLCDECDGRGEISVHHPETGTDIEACANCAGSGYNQLGLILQGILEPPEGGYGPTELTEALQAYRVQLEKHPEQSEDSQAGLLLYLKNYLRELRLKRKIS